MVKFSKFTSSIDSSRGEVQKEFFKNLILKRFYIRFSHIVTLSFYIQSNGNPNSLIKVTGFSRLLGNMYFHYVSLDSINFCDITVMRVIALFSLKEDMSGN